eukprot:COSAG02_NODE_2369_length_9049_cov_37.484358_6_plen_173_part_00
MKLRALTRHAERVGVTEEELDDANSTDDVIALILELAAKQRPLVAVSLPFSSKTLGGAEGAASEPEPELEPLAEQESHGIAPSASTTVESHGTTMERPVHDDVFDFVFSNKTNCDAVCLKVREQLVARGLTVWQQKTNIPKDSDNWFAEWFPSAQRAKKIVCFVNADYLTSP